MHKIVMAAAAALALAGCKQAGTGAEPVTQAEATRIAETVEADYGSGDVNKIGSHYSAGAVAFDAANVAPTRDSKVLKAWTGQFVSMKPADYQVSDRNIQLVGPDAFVSSGIGRFTVQAGQARPQVGVRFTQVFQRQKDGQWKIVHEHMSMPPTPPGALK